MIETPNPEINVEDLMQRIRDELALRRTGSTLTAHGMLRPSSASGSPSKNLYMETMQLPRFDVKGSNFPIKKSYNLSDFLNFHDETFIRNAYQGILNREPDGNGLAHYLIALRSGRYAKAEILGRLRYSAEGRAHAVRINGLFLPFLFQMAYRIPILGYIFAWANFLLRLPSVVSNWSRFEAFVESQYHEQTHRLNQLAEQAEKNLHALRQQTTEREYYHSQKLEESTEEIKHHMNNVLLGETSHQEQLTALHVALADKVNQNEILVLRTELADKANIKRLADIEANVSTIKETVSSLGDKIQAEIITGQVDKLQQNLNTKANQADLDDVWNKLNVKADVGLFEDWNARLSTIADSGQLANLVNRIDVFSEQINLTLCDIQRQILDHKRNIVDQQRRLTLLLEEARKRLPEPIQQDQIECMLAEQDHLLDAFYVGFEDCFRGTREDIKQRMEVYIPIVQDVKAGGESAPILDVGCGRGEWLELLKDIGLTASGIDLNRIMVRQCQETGLEVIEAEAINHLRKLSTNSLGAVTGMHIIEHIPFKQLIMFFDEVLRVLKPGGVAIFESPNPENLITASCNFYYDPTHINPLPPEPIRFVLEIRGFSRVEIKRLHPYPEESRLKEGPAAVRKIINERFFGEQDYALLAYKT